MKFEKHIPPSLEGNPHYSAWKLEFDPFVLVRVGKQWRIEGDGYVGWNKDIPAQDWLATVGLDAARFPTRAAAHDTLKPVLRDFENQDFLANDRPDEGELAWALAWQLARDAADTNRTFHVTEAALDAASRFEADVEADEVGGYWFSLRPRD